MFTKIHNVVIAVKNVEEAAKLYSNNFGLQASKSVTRPDLGLRNALLPIGDATIELATFRARREAAGWTAEVEFA